jgi:hypothetical protein
MSTLACHINPIHNILVYSLAGFTSGGLESTACPSTQQCMHLGAIVVHHRCHMVLLAHQLRMMMIQPLLLLPLHVCCAGQGTAGAQVAQAVAAGYPPQASAAPGLVGLGGVAQQQQAAGGFVPGLQPYHGEQASDTHPHHGGQCLPHFGSLVSRNLVCAAAVWLVAATAVALQRLLVPAAHAPTVTAGMGLDK